MNQGGPSFFPETWVRPGLRYKIRYSASVEKKGGGYLSSDEAIWRNLEGSAALLALTKQSKKWLTDSQVLNGVKSD